MEKENQPIEDRDKNCLECGMLYSECVLPFVTELANLNGFRVKRLRILCTFDNLKGHLIIF